MAFYKSTITVQYFYLLLATCVIVSACHPQTTSTNLSLIELHNQARQSGIKCGLFMKHKAPKLTWNPLLEQAAEQHSQEMFTHSRLSHISIANLNPGDRIKAAGYDWISYAENIASGVSTNAAVFELWLDSSEHCINIANTDYTEMGAAQVNGFWTAVYAKPQ